MSLEKTGMQSPFAAPEIISNKQKIPVFIISLARAPERREAISQHMNKLGVEYRMIDAVDGKTIAPSKIAEIVAPGKEMHPGAVGCYLSHINVYEMIRDENIEVALVLEDDARLNPRVLNLLLNGCDYLDWDYCFLDSDDHNDQGPVFYDAGSGRVLGAGFTAYSLSSGPQTLHAYLITRTAAIKRLAHAFPLEQPIDLYAHLPYHIHFCSLIHPKAAWVSEFSLNSFTSVKSGTLSDLSLVFLRRWPIFYRLRDLLRLKDFKRNRLIMELQAEGKLPVGPRWRALPSGREILIG